MKEEINQIIQEFNIIQSANTDINNAVKKLVDNNLYPQFVQQLAVIFCKMKVSVFDKAVASMEKVKQQYPQIENVPEIVLMTGQWGADREEARQELLNAKLGDIKSQIEVMNNFGYCTRLINSIFIILSKLEPSKDVATIGVHLSELNVKLMETAIKYNKENGPYSDLPEDSELGLQIIALQDGLASAKASFEKLNETLQNWK